MREKKWLLVLLVLFLVNIAVGVYAILTYEPNLERSEVVLPLSAEVTI